MPYGSSVYAQVTVTNAYGTSVTSLSGNGAVILTVPTAVVVSNYIPGTNADQVTIVWTQAESNGGSAILDYQIKYAEGGGAYSILASGVTDLTYVLSSVNTGSSYKFIV